MSPRKIIGVVGGEDARDWIDVLSALAGSCGLGLRQIRLDEASTVAGLIVPGNLSAPEEAQLLGYGFLIRVIPAEAFAQSGDVQFGTGPGSPAPFRGRTVTTGSAVPGDQRNPPGEVIATAGGKPVWISALGNGLRHDTCWVSHPWIKKGDCAFDHLNGNRFMNLLPILEWMRSVSDWREWQQPPLQACFMFDDPNFHATRYGFVKYAELAAEGRLHHYHTSFATVPLDSYYVNPAAARIIRENGDTLSFLVHGNNHTYRELSDRQATPARQLSQMQQAVFRISQLEKKAGVAVSRVMAPPHGVCSAEMMTAMRETGFEAVCVSHGSVWAGNPGADWAVSLGALPTMVVSGLPVIPRFRLNRKMENHVLLAAYLHQPIVPVGHHWDLADGIDILSSGARFINGLGEVLWNDMATIARRNYRCRVEGQLMRIHAFSRLIRVNVPDNVTELELEAPWLDPVQDRIEIRGPGLCAPTAACAIGERVAVSRGTLVEVAVVRIPRPVEEALKPPRTPLSVIGRKVLVELRDHVMPFLPRGFAKR